MRDGWPLRRALQARLALLFRRAMLDPAAAFIFLALTALDLERLRGELLRRAAFPGVAMAGARMIRPQPARWFEILAARDDATLVLEALATTGAVELEARPSAVLPAALADLRPQLSEFAELSLRYHAYWPRAKRTSSPFPEPPAVTLARSLAHLRAWAEDAEPVIQQLQRVRGGARASSCSGAAC